MNDEKEVIAGTTIGTIEVGPVIDVGTDAPERAPTLHDRMAMQMITAIRNALRAGSLHFDSSGIPLVEVSTILHELVDGPGYAIVERGKPPRRVVLSGEANRRKRRAHESAGLDIATGGPELRAALERLGWGKS